MYFERRINRGVIVQMVFGSHLYGTSTPTSDKDFKGIFLPHQEGDLYLCKTPKSMSLSTKTGEGKNTPDDIDAEFYSYQEFIKLACEGQTVALDMLHAPKDMLIHSSWIWDKIVAERSRFYTKNLNAFVGYARRQASKYGIKGSRLSSAQSFIDLLNRYPDDAKLSVLWNEIQTNEHVQYFEVASPVRHIQICGKLLQETFRVDYSREVIQKFVDAYGHRAEQAARNEGIDWKAVSHAIRAAYQVQELLTTGNITFPLKEAEYIKAVKSGKFDYVTEVAPKLENMMTELETLSAKSNLPERADRKYWDEFIVKTLKMEYELSAI